MNQATSFIQQQQQQQQWQQQQPQCLQLPRLSSSTSAQPAIAMQCHMAFSSSAVSDQWLTGVTEMLRFPVPLHSLQNVLLTARAPRFQQQQQQQQ
jgi:hypothetical protein